MVEICTGALGGLHGLHRSRGAGAPPAHPWLRRCLPHLSTFKHGLSGYSRMALPVNNGFGEVYFTTNDKYTMSLRKVVLSASPDSGSKCIVVASSFHTITQTLALWQPGMKSWHVCDGLPIVGPKDFAFYQGKLYVLLRFIPRLYAFELKEDDRGVVVSRVEHCGIEPLHEHRVQDPGVLSCNIVVCVATYY